MWVSLLDSTFALFLRRERGRAEEKEREMKNRRFEFGGN